MKYAGSLYRNHTDASIAQAVDFLTANELNGRAKAVSYWREGAQENMAEAQNHGIEPITDWADVWAEVRERLSERY